MLHIHASVAKRLVDEGLKTRCGTPAFIAPEILLGIRYGSKVDIWSCGVIIYMLLGGYPPFQGSNPKDLFRKIRAADYVFHDKYWTNVSVEAKQLIASMLRVDADVRVDASAALKSDWMRMDEEDLSESDLSDSLMAMRNYNAKRKLKGAMSAVSWATSATFWDVGKVSFSERTLRLDSHTHTANDVLAGWSKNSTSTSSSSSSSTIGSKYQLAGDKVGKTFKDVYDLEETIRSGSFATIWKARHKASGQLFAVKVVMREDLKSKDDAQFLQEVFILKSLKHNNIVALNDFYEEKDYFYLVMELLDGGDVFDRIVEKNHYTELDARDLASELLGAIAYMHERGIAHRDLKPQNLLLVSKEDDADIKVADFGFAKRVAIPNSLMTRCGTPTYVAPEILKNHPHDEMVDMWSVGVMTYVLLVGYPPFMEENQRQLFRKVRMGEYEFFEEDWEGISPEAKDLISKLLVVDPSKRLKASAALKHPWLCEVDGDTLSNRDLSISLNSLKSSRGIMSLTNERGAKAEWMAEPREAIE
jgi:calcium/calmodulin-dependent protein kinase (CaM kinase) II/calcium/calmodulin-dependent protein kinase I